MAFVTIQRQPRRFSVCGTLTNIDFQFIEQSADTVNVIVQCFWLSGGAWQEIGGKIRVASNLYNPQIYNFNAAGVAALLDKAELSDLTALGSGDSCSGGLFDGLITNTMANYSDFGFILEVQREYLDSATNTIKLDPDITVSKEFYVWEASPPISNNIYNYWSGTQQTERYMFPYLMTNNNNGNGNWLWMTDCVLQKGKLKINNAGQTTVKRLPMYEVTIKPIEQYYIFCGNGNLRSGITNYNKIVIRTFNYQNVILNTHTYDWNTLIFGGYSNAGRCYFDAGWRTLKNALVFNGNENFGNAVSHYQIYNMVSDDNNNLNTPSVSWMFTIDRECTKVATPLSSYQRFSWKNAMGGFDFFTSEGMLKTERKFKPSRYEKRQQYLGSATKGKQNYQTDVEYRHKVTSHEMSNLDAEWFSKMLASPQTYVRVEIARQQNSAGISETNLIGMDTPAYYDFDILEGLRDGAKCNEYIPIVIETKSIQISTTKENRVKIKFAYSYSADNQYLRD